MSAKESNPGPKTITIDLSESQNADLFKGGDERLLQQTALNRVKEIIRELSEKVQKIKTNPPPMYSLGKTHRHDVITINGERGSGKTTFILNILNLIPDWYAADEIKCSIKSLDIIDPTMIEDCEHIFLAVISKIKEVVENHWEEKRTGSNAETVDMRYQIWRTSLVKLAGGLRNLSTKKDMDGDSWSDPQFIMEEGLENSAQGVKLEQHFHCFVEESLNFIDAGAFIIALDDVDTKVDTGWPVLEVLRKYLTTPRLIVILSGDIELYTQLISNKQCEQIGIKPEKIIEKPEEYANSIRLVNDLTEQYMMKIMRPDYRIEMQTVVQITKQKRYRVRVKYGISKKEEEIEKLLISFCSKIYGSNFQSSYLAEVLMDVPTRTCIKLLNTATKYLESLDLEENEIEKKEDHFEAIVGLGHVFQNSLSTAGLSSKLINEIEAELHMNLGYLAVALHKKNLLKQGFHLFPLQAITSQRQLMMVLGAVYSRALTKQPAMMLFGYLVNMCLPAYLQGVLAKKSTNERFEKKGAEAKNSTNNMDYFDRYLEASQLEMEQEPINSVKRGMKFLIGGGLPENELPEYKNFKGSFTFCSIEVDVSPPVTTWHRLILDMCCVFTEKEDTSQRNLSFYSLLGAIATLAGSIKLPKDEKNPSRTDIDNNKKDVLKILRQYGSEDNLGFAKEPLNKSLGKLRLNLMKETFKDEEDEFAELFARWCWKTSEEKSLPVLALTESWNRFLSVPTHLKEKYSKDFGKEKHRPGNFLQDCIVYFLSNLLEYEMVIMDIVVEGATPLHHKGIEAKFASRLGLYFNQKSTSRKKCLIFEYIFSCPLWMHFINLTDNAGDWEKISTCYVGRLNDLLPKGNLTKEKLKDITRCIAGKEGCANLFELMNDKNACPGSQE